MLRKNKVGSVLRDTLSIGKPEGILKCGSHQSGMFVVIFNNIYFQEYTVIKGGIFNLRQDLKVRNDIFLKQT